MSSRLSVRVCVAPLTAGDLSLVRAVRTLRLSIAAPAARDTLTIQTRKLSWGTRLPSWRESERESEREREGERREERGRLIH